MIRILLLKTTVKDGKQQAETHQLMVKGHKAEAAPVSPVAAPVPNAAADSDVSLPNAASRRRVVADGLSQDGMGGGLVATVTEVQDPDTISDILPDANNVLWVDISDPGPNDFALMRREFGFHPLALEDVAAPHERPKLDEYENYYFIVFYAALLVEGRLRMSEISLFLGKNYLVTVHRSQIAELDESLRRWQHNAANITPAVGVLFYSIIDSLVDRYLGVLDGLVDKVDDIEEQIFGSANSSVGPDALNDLFDLKKELLMMRRVAAPERDLVNAISRRDNPILPPQTLIYFQDIYDHLVRVTDSLDTYRDLLSSALDAQLSITSNRLNQIMKTLTVVTTILMGITLVPSIYGMNFQNIPELSWPTPFGYPSALFLMLGIAAGIYFIFKRKRWI